MNIELKTVAVTEPTKMPSKIKPTISSFLWFLMVEPMLLFKSPEILLNGNSNPEHLVIISCIV